MDLVAADADPAKDNDEIAITEIAVRTFLFMIFRASPCTCSVFLTWESFHHAEVGSSERVSASPWGVIPYITEPL